MSGTGIENKFVNYWTNVIDGWDDVSHATKVAVQKAHCKLWILANSFRTPDDKLRVWDYILSMETDGVWTKVQIYMRQFENFYQEFEQQGKTEDSYELLYKRAVELSERTLADLTAMLFDDGINWEQAIAFTNIIDVNDTDWERARIFFMAFKDALASSILQNQVILTNGETANLGEDPKFIRALNRYQDDGILMIEDIKADRQLLSSLKDLAEYYNEQGKFDGEIEKLSDRIGWKISRIKETKEFLIALLAELDLNIGWTFLWIKSAKEEDKKLVELEEGDVIIGFGERPTKDGIISPRSNWLTLIRESMLELLWDNWENKTFEDYLDVIGEKRVNLPLWMVEKLKGLKMWDIATGKTTVFNWFISDELLWGINWDPIVNISCLRHGTWNPQFKQYKWLWWRRDICFVMDLSNSEQADIMTLIQVGLDIDDTLAAKSWNMWLPFTGTCKKWNEEEIIKRSIARGIPAQVIWIVKNREEWEAAVTMTWVGIGGSTIEYREAA